MPLLLDRPLAITMWDFSWLERRWPGAGYEDWAEALDGLVERGYDAIRIDAYPHLVAAGAERTWTLEPVWDQQVWGSPAITRVRVQPALNEFLAACRERGLKVALSSWFRADEDQTHRRIDSAAAMAAIWVATLRTIEAAGLLDTLLWVDLCNEWPGDLWAPYFRNDPPELTWGGWHTAVSMAWMRDSLATVRAAFPGLPLCYSLDGMDDRFYHERDLRGSGFDLLEHHCWMAKENDGEFAKTAGYGYERFSSVGYRNLALHAEALYRARPDYWQGLLTARIGSLAEASRAAGLPLATTECWGIVDYKDWPLLDWGWVKELCALGTLTAAATGRWSVIATSNFCGPQFAGMWRDVGWHRRLTDAIHAAPLEAALRPGGKPL
jgi:hypothetical protein